MVAFHSEALLHDIASWYWLGSSSDKKMGLVSEDDAFMLTICFGFLVRVERRGSGMDGA